MKVKTATVLNILPPPSSRGTLYQALQPDSYFHQVMDALLSIAQKYNESSTKWRRKQELKKLILN